MNDKQQLELKSELERRISFVSKEGVTVNVKGCDNSLRMTHAFLDDRGLMVKQELSDLRARGCFCDCEVLLSIRRERRRQ